MASLKITNITVGKQITAEQLIEKRIVMTISKVMIVGSSDFSCYVRRGLVTLVKFRRFFSRFFPSDFLWMDRRFVTLTSWGHLGFVTGLGVRWKVGSRTKKTVSRGTKIDRRRLPTAPL